MPELGSLIEVRRGTSVLWQVDHLGDELPDKLHGGIQWRLFFPVIGRVLHLPPVIFFGLAHVGCVVVLAFIISILRRKGLGFFETGLAALMFGSASWFFASAGWLGYFDSWLVLALLLVAFARERWPVWLACIGAPWIDERFVVAVPLAMLCRWLLRSSEAKGEAPVFEWKKELAVPAGIIAAFLAIRLGFLSGRSGSNATISGYLGSLNALDAPWSRFVFGIWEGLRAGWLLVVAAVWLSWGRRSQAMGLGATVVAVMAVSLATAQDFSRSMMFVAPVALLGVVFAVEAGSRWLPLVLRVGTVAALLLPAHLVMSDRVNPIYYLYHELAAFDSPPAAVMPELHELRGIHAMERGDFVEAAEELTLAIRLAQNPAGPSKQRGILFASQQRWKEARQDFSTMVEHDPDNPEGWMLRAQAELALGDARAADADMNLALERAPVGWADRPDVTRFRARLRQQGGAK